MSQPVPPPYQPGPPAPGPGPMLDMSRSPAIPFTRLVKVELRKSLDTIAGFWLLVAIAVLMIIIDGFLLVAGLTNGDSGFRFIDFTVGVAYVLQPLVATLVIMQVTSEWGQRTAMVTFSIEPRRLAVIYAKLAAGVVLSLLLVVVMFVVAVACAALLGLAQDNVEWSIGAGDVFGPVLFELVAVAIGFALATLILNTPGAIVAFPAVLYAVPTALAIIGGLWVDFREVGRHLNLQSAINPLLTGTLDTGTEWRHLVVALLVWVALPLTLGMVRILRAEVK